MSQCVWELLSIEKSFITKYDKCESDTTYYPSRHFECHNAHSADIRSEKIDYDYAEDLSQHCKKKNEKNKLKFEKIMHKFFISDISKYVKAYVKKNDSNIRSEIGITSSKGTNSEEERNWINSYIYNFISYCLMTYNDCKHYIVITSCSNLIQKLTGTGYGYYGIYFTNGKKIGGMGNLFIKINQVRHISYSIMKTLQTRPASDRSMSNNDETSSFTFPL
ncbi:conserved Plasmodium protein, unknown function [Plasmodium knowlesi strain H]|uniref:Uncharacterized protein n=3 Tax=Plasmodium knowlesi TaxID=5850 RepID=A0A5K1VKK4_PLAKH|nr:conserved Plasmodium protein, unknown function [Plasmodium knowlesi strain H]OTN65634.1 Uncharacterized protein PKNOH_S110079000 [Plasmodium knowlesi]CAA9989411.1 conserved Plasmodium protein, unknown function [Plasmodium knowlesi strain H]SBO25018.1 conserved Plasmodium protein, unknown function [Plasmodium knowlesi strain H]SBO27861.1 conserved Plasmodium protein, unknown function [Plasmodium knowlesi strain H]VVS78885.1 conserved Plasmodium protein, unknown function [Plasmodium knowlesi |eukprot:XP_002260138.1 hypothetical protein, conserved in Plasmodium species [Plasmodium knowlesi strain H]